MKIAKEYSDSQKLKELAEFHSNLEFDNLFKHDIKQNELGRFGGLDSNWAIFKATGFAPWCNPNSKDNLNYALGLLFAGRGDKEKANEYWKKVKDESMLKTLWSDIP